MAGSLWLNGCPHLGSSIPECGRAGKFLIEVSMGSYRYCLEEGAATAARYSGVQRNT